MKTLLFLRGCPGSGKKTIGTILAERLGWKLFWLHDIDPIYEIVGEHRLPRLQDEVSAAILRELCRQGKDIIFVRAAREKESIFAAQDIAEDFGYKFEVVKLEADYRTILARVCLRAQKPFRVGNEDQLEDYLTAREEEKFPGEYIISTNRSSPADVADSIITILAKEPQVTV